MMILATMDMASTSELKVDATQAEIRVFDRFVPAHVDLTFRVKT